MGSISFIPINVSREMRSREKPLWIGKPDPLKLAMMDSGSTTLNGIFFLGFGAYLAYTAGHTEATLPIVAAFVCFGFAIYFLSMPVLEYLRAKKTLYVVTNQRIIILNGLWRPTVDSFAPSEIGSIHIRVAPDGSGTVIFQERRSWLAQGGRMFKTIGFKAVADVREAEKHIRELKGQASPDEGPDAEADKERSAWVERYRGYQIERVGQTYRVGDDVFIDSASAKAHIDANWRRSQQ